jgi:hypothetical protein
MGGFNAYISPTTIRKSLGADMRLEKIEVYINGKETVSK